MGYTPGDVTRPFVCLLLLFVFRGAIRTDELLTKCFEKKKRNRMVIIIL